MHIRFIQPALLACFSFLLVHSAMAEPIPTPTKPPISPPPTPSPIPDPGDVIILEPTPTIPPINPPPTPTVPPAPTIPPVLDRPDPQRATAVIRYGPGRTLALTPKNEQGRFQKIALQPEQVVTVMMRLSLADFGKPADVQILDGGAISSDAPNPKEVVPPTPTPRPTIGIDDPTGPSPGPEPVPTPDIEQDGDPLVPDPNTLVDSGQTLPVSEAGQLMFNFRVGADIGLHRVSVIVGGAQYFFQFWRQDPNAPNNNPGMLRAY